MFWLEPVYIPLLFNSEVLMFVFGKLYIWLFVILLTSCPVFAVTNYLAWLGVDSDWTNPANWDNTYDPANPANFVNIYNTANDPIIAAGVTTDHYRELKLGVGTVTLDPVCLTINGGTLDMDRMVDGNGYLNVGHSTGTYGSLILNDGLISVMQITAPRLGYADIDMTGGIMQLDRVRMGGTAGHGGGVFNMSGGEIQMYDNAGVIQYLGLGYKPGAQCTFNLSGGFVDVDLLYVGMEGNADMNISGGSVYARSGLRMSSNGAESELNISNGTVIVAGEGLAVGYGLLPAAMTVSGGTVESNYLIVGRSSFGQGKINLDGGTVTVNLIGGFSIGVLSEGVDITGGTLLLKGNNVSAVNTYVSGGQIKAYGGLADVKVWYNSADNFTTVTAGGILRSDLNNDDIVDFVDFAILADEWLEQNTLKRIKLTVDHNKVSGDLTDFPLLITEKVLPEAFWLMAADNIGRLNFKLSDDTALDYELATFDKDSRKLEIYVSVPLLSSGSDTEIYMELSGTPETVTGKIWDAEDYAVVYHMNDKAPAGRTSSLTHLLNTSYANQGLAFDGEYFYWGRNMGEYTDGRIYKIDMDGNIVDYFPGPTHSTGADIREDHDTLIFSNCCGIDNREIWEIDKSSGVKIRSWTIAGSQYIDGGMIAYKEENTVYMLGAEDGSTNYNVYELYLSDNGSYFVINTWAGLIKPGIRTQGMDYHDGYLWYLYDSFDPNPTIEIALIELPDNGVVKFADTIRSELAIEGEGLAFYGDDLYFGTVDHRIYRLANPSALEVSGVYDSAANSHHLARIGSYGLSGIPSPVGYAQVFDGNNTYLLCSNPVAVSSLSDFTFEVWARLDDISENARFFNLSNQQGNLVNDGFAFKPYYDGSVYKLGIWNGSWLYGTAIAQPRGKYHYFAAASNGSTVTFYYDGQAAGTASCSTVTSFQPGALCVGGADFGDYFGSDYPEYLARGTFDEVRISKTVRNAAWIQATHNNLSSPETFVQAEIE